MKDGVPIKEISNSELTKMSDSELREHGQMRLPNGAIAHLSDGSRDVVVESLAAIANPPPPPKMSTPPQMSARERLAAAQAELKAIHQRAMEKFSADLEYFCVSRGYRIGAKPVLRLKSDGTYAVSADVVISVANQDRDMDGLDGDE